MNDFGKHFLTGAQIALQIAGALTVTAAFAFCLWFLFAQFKIRRDEAAVRDSQVKSAQIEPAQQPASKLTKPSPLIETAPSDVTTGTDIGAAPESSSVPAAAPPPAPTYYIAPQQPRRPVTGSKTVAFMPGEAVNFPNRQFRKVEIHSEYPLRILTGHCHQDFTVEFVCEGDPADVFIVDTRRRPIFMTPRANTVTITVTEF
jgi:hypothetical protein